jgi:hypothetical protein
MKYSMLTWSRTLLLGLALSSSTVLNGCVTKASADARAREAFLAGQHQAMQQSQMRQAQTQIHGPTVTFVGPVRNSLLPWNIDLTLAKAFVAAGYYAPTDPQAIIIVREGREIPVDVKGLLGGQDIPLQPQDVIEVR